MKNNGDKKKYKRLSFVNDGMLCVVVIVLFIILAAMTLAEIMFWNEFPVIITVLYLLVAPIMFLAIVFMPFNGMFIKQDGTVIYVPDFRIIKCKTSDLERLAVTFTKWENGKYSAKVKLVYRNGKIVSSDYSDQFRRFIFRVARRSNMRMYTIKRVKVDKLASELRKLDKCVVTIIDDRLSYRGW